MVEWEPVHLHWSFNGEHVLFPFIVVESFTGFLFASLLLIVICATERIITSYHDDPRAQENQRSKWRSALERCLIYWIAMMLRLFYMLAAMTFNMGLILTIATTLAVTQLILDIRSHSHPRSPSHHHLPTHHYIEAVDLDEADPFSLHPSSGSGVHISSSTSTFVALEPVSVSTAPKPYQHHVTVSTTATPAVGITTRPRSKSKPDSIFIHPAESNIARADALAMRLGIAGNAERVDRVVKVGDGGGGLKWETGKGPDVARELLNKPSPHKLHRRSGSFQIGGLGSDESDEDSDEDDSSEVRKLVP